MKENKGTTLIEIIVVVTILSILAGGSISGINYIKHANTKKCAYRINDELYKVRLQAVSQLVRPYLYIYQYKGSYYMTTDTATPTADLLDDSGTLLGNNQLALYYQTNLSAVDHVIGDFTSGNYMKISFSKDTGGVTVNSSDSSYYNKILIKDSKGTLRYTIHLIQSTGKHYIEK